ncbi:MAG: hypothetical protein NTU83_11585 [Candidatus Hydrogenedentes bacterium]|nr:hypothetical protein [Candidatus Hydrogenedentota bacterium]
MNRLPELAKTPLDQFQPIPAFSGTKTLTAEAEAWGVSCRAVPAQEVPEHDDVVCSL